MSFDQNSNEHLNFTEDELLVKYPIRDSKKLLAVDIILVIS